MTNSNRKDVIDVLCERASRMLFGRPRRIAAAIPVLEEASRLGSPWAKWVLADVLLERSKARRDLLRAADLLKAAALGGEASAALALGACTGKDEASLVIRWRLCAGPGGRDRAC